MMHLTDSWTTCSDVCPINSEKRIPMDEIFQIKWMIIVKSDYTDCDCLQVILLKIAIR